ncbi:MAG: hypothetical protein Q8P71_00460 [bacterium]|nr:hypothetical protein [bacterium]
MIRQVFIRKDEAKYLECGVLMRLSLEGIDATTSPGGEAIILSFYDIVWVWKERDGLFFPRELTLTPEEWDCALRSIGLHFYPPRPAARD